MGIGELLDRSLRLYRRNFFRLIGTLAIVAIPYHLITLLYTIINSQLSTEMAAIQPGDLSVLGPMGSIMGGSLIVMIAGLVLYQGFGTAATTRAVVDDILGTPSGPIATYRKIGRTWWKMISTVILLALLNVVLAIWTIVPCVGWLSGPGMLVIVSMVMMPLAAPVVVIELLGGRSAIRRTWDLVRRRFWPVIGLVLVLGLLAYIIAYVPSLILSSIFTYVLSDSFSYLQTTTITSIIQSLSTMLLTLIASPLQFIAITFLYFDLRVRTEGLDLALQASSEIPQEQNDLHALLATQAPPPENTPLIKGQDIGNFVLVTLAIIGLYLVLIMGIGVIAMLISPGL
jgi:putative flippase GtrA